MLPSIDRLAAGERRASQRACRMLVLAPTRELAGQIADLGPLLRPVRRDLRVRHRPFGGTSIGQEPPQDRWRAASMSSSPRPAA